MFLPDAHIQRPCLLGCSDIWDKAAQNQYDFVNCNIMTISLPLEDTPLPTSLKFYNLVTTHDITNANDKNN